MLKGRITINNNVMNGRFGNILIVDDSNENLSVLSHILSPNYRVSVANSGIRAIEILTNRKDFDLFLLDIMMPEVDGIELCKRIKSMPEFYDIPVIFISGLSDIEDKKLAFESGGVDYIVKPFDKEEVLLRVGTHIKIRQLQRELINKNVELEKNYNKLKELEDLRDNLINMIVHDLRSPLTGVLSMFEMIKMECSDIDKPELMEFIKSGYSAANSLLEMINSLLDVARLEEGKLPLDIKSYSLADIVNEVLELIKINFKYYNIVTEIDDNLSVQCDRDLIKRVIVNLISNSIKHSKSKSPIKVRAEKNEKDVVVSIIDDGIGISEEFHNKIFEKFGQVQLRKENKRYSTGLGLAFCKLAVEAHRGKIWVESKLGSGSKFYFTIPQIY